MPTDQLVVNSTHGLFVGIDEYKWGGKSINSLYGCANDARELSRAAGPALTTNDVIVNEGATRKGILTSIESTLRDKCGSGDLFIFFCACHGEARYGEFFLWPHDHDSRTFLSTALLFQDIANMMGDREDVNTLIAIDACQAGAIGFEPADHTTGQLSSIMMAAAPMEVSQEYGEEDVENEELSVSRRHGKFAYGLIENLDKVFSEGGQGAATIAQLFDLAYHSTKVASGNAQHPIMVGTLPASLVIRRAD
jgi:hypothetical protein